MGKYKEKREKINTLVDKNKFYTANDAISILKEVDASKFNETIDLSVQLGIDPKVG